MLPKPSKDLAIRYLRKYLPEYGEMLYEIERNRGWIKLNPCLYQSLENLKLTDYAKFYAEENVLNKLFFVACLDSDEFKEVNRELEQATEEERTAFLDEWIISMEQEGDNDLFPSNFPLSPEEEEQARKQLESLNDAERAEHYKRSYCFLAFFMINFHDYIALMVHGRKMTQLVAEALQQDDTSFVLAVQIDPSVMQSIPYFQERETRAYREGDTGFLDKLAYRRRIPPLQGKIRFRLLYLLFAMLEGMNLLDDLTGNEILDICDAAGLDRWQNRIEDVNYLNKRKAEYRRFQQHKNIYESMH